MARALLALALLAFFMAPVGACEDQVLDRAVIPQERFDDSASRRHAIQVGLLAHSKNVKTAAVGDSIIQRWPADLMQTVFQHRVINLGVSGDRTQNVLWRLNHLDLSENQFEHIVVMVGTNNLRAGDSPCSIARGITKIASLLRDKQPSAKIVVLGILPRGLGFSFRKADISKINAELTKRQSSDVVFINPADMLDGNAEEYFLGDQVHLSPFGYASITQLLRSRIPPR